MNITDKQLRRLVELDPKNEVLLEELRARLRWSLIRKIPNRTGRCTKHGQRIYWDETGAYSTGYPGHMTEDGHLIPGYCDDFQGIVNDPPSAKEQHLRRLIDSLR